jgi:hypothetical protein
VLIDEHLEVNPVTLIAVSDVWQGPGWWLAPDGKWYSADGGPEGAAPVDTVIADVSAPAEVETPTVDSPTLDTPVVDIPIAETPVVDIPIAEAPVVDIPIVEAPVVETPAASGGGWQAAEPEVDEDEATSEEGWTSGFTGEIPEVGAPVPGGPVGEDPGGPVGVDTVAAASILAAPLSTAASEKSTGRRAPDPIHRDEAWRKPNEDDLPLEAASTSRGAPEVVDLAVPKPIGTEGTIDEDTGVSPVLLAIGVTAALLLMAVVINYLFFGDDDDTDVNTDPVTSTSAAPTDTTDTTFEETTVQESTTIASVPAEGVEISVFDLQAGDCIESEIGTGQVQKLIKVNCELAHEFEVYREALVDRTIETYDVDAIEAQAQELCRTSLAGLIPEGDDRDLMYKWFQPTEQSWNQAGNPDRVITCLLFDEDEKLFGTVG